MKTIAFTRVSTDKQTTDNQKLVILEYAQNNRITLDEIIETTVSSKKNREEREIDTLIERMNDRDHLIVYSLDRLGRSTLETLQIIEDIKNKGIILTFIKENIIIDKHNTNPMNEMMLTLLSGFAQLERSFISERTKLGLEARKAQGIKLGRQKGQQVTSIFDDHKSRIKELVFLGVTHKKIHENINIGTVQSLGKYIKSREIK
jgi:DNA invertase Pin-like site-specific DNA recombinase